MSSAVADGSFVPPDTSKAALYLVVVDVRYTLRDQSTTRCFTVRIVAPTEDSARAGALAWAQQQTIPDSVHADAKAFAYAASVADRLGSVDCIAESCVRSAL